MGLGKGECCAVSEEHLGSADELLLKPPAQSHRE
jgi:hypothetical protein